MKKHQLFIPRKADEKAPNKESYGVDMRAIEEAFNHLPEQTSGAGYASLTGPGQTTTPGELDQAGPFTVSSTTGSILLEITAGSGGIVLLNQGTGQLEIQSQNSIIQINALDTGTALSIFAPNGSVSIQSQTGFNVTDNTGIFFNTIEYNFQNMPTVPGNPGDLWNNGGVVNIS